MPFRPTRVCVAAAPAVSRAVAACLVAFAAGCAGQPARRAPSALLASDTVYTAVDVETTGLDPATDRIVEVGAVKFGKGRAAVTKSWLIKPGIPIGEAARKVNGISDAMVADCPRFASVAGEIRAFLGGSVLLMHNARFDLEFLSREYALAGVPGPGNRVVDTLVLFRRWFPGRRSYSLGALGSVAGRRASRGTHRAREDAELLREIFEAGLEKRPSESLPGILRQAGIGSPGIGGAEAR